VQSDIPALSSEAEASAAERRIVTVLFADLASSTQMAAAMDPEELRTLLSEYFARMTRELHLHGGTVEKYIGDAVMAVFGLPLAHEDDPLRAVRAALGMRAALRTFNEDRRLADPASGELHMRIGINTGEVMAASGPGPAEGRDFLVTGDAVNIAARLQQVARPDSILVGPRTFRATRGAVRYHALPTVEVRGKALPIYAWEAVEMAGEGPVPAPRPRGIEGLRAPLVGRDAELDLMRVLYTRAVSERHPHLVTVFGMPGMGKTRLTREFANRLLGVSSVAGPDVPPAAERSIPQDTADAPRILEGRCPPYGEGITYWPLVEVLRAYCDLSPFDEPAEARAQLLRCVTAAVTAAGRLDDAKAVAEYLAHTVGIEPAERAPAAVPADAQQLQDGLFRAWRVFFTALAQVRPTIVLIEDVHWADDALLDLLEYLAARITDVPLLLLCTARPELLERRPAWGRGQRNGVTLDLEPLSEEEAASLVRALLPGRHIPESLRQGIQDKAEGNPFYIEEIVRMLVDRGILVHVSAQSADEDGGDGTWLVAPEWEESGEVRDPVIPDTVQGVVAARLDLLPVEERRVLQDAAVIGRYFWAGALRVLAPELSEEMAGMMLDTLAQKGLIRESASGARLVAPGARVYTFKNVLVREVAYATIPRARRAQEHAKMAAWLEGLAVGRDGVFLELLARHYLQYYTQGNLARSRNVARRQAVRTKALDLLTRVGDAEVARHAAARAVDHYSDALTLLEEDAARQDIPARVDLLMKRGDARWLQSSGDAAWADYRAALDLWLDFGTEGAPADWTRQGLRLYELLVLLPTRNSSWFRDPPSHEELREYLDQGLELVDELGQRETLEGAALLTAKSFFWWSWSERRGEKELLDALGSAREAVRIAEALGDARGASQALDALGNLQATTTDVRGRLESQTRRLAWAGQIEDTRELVDIQAEVSGAYESVGEYARAAEHAQAALHLANDADNDLMRVQALEREVIAYFQWDRWPDALRAGEQLVALVAHTTLAAQTTVEGTQRYRSALLALAIAYTRMGQESEADEVVRLVREVPEARDGQMVVLYRARLALARSSVEEAERLLLTALELRSGHPMMAAVLAELAEVDARRGDRARYERFGPQALEMGWRSGARKALAQAIRARGLAAMAEGRWEDAESELHNALGRYVNLGTRWEEARTRTALADLAQQRAKPGDGVVAHEEWERAAQLFAGVHAVAEAASARAALTGEEVRLS
jgi:class 3 adenylate cyclase/tetratricopeptide (TPR) repeat protein